MKNRSKVKEVTKMSFPTRLIARLRTNNARMFSSIPQSSYLPAADVKQRVINCVSSLQSSPSNILEHRYYRYILYKLYFNVFLPSVISHFVVDLGFDSLERKQIINNVTDEFRIKINEKDASSLLSVSDVISYIVTHPKAR